MKRRILSLFLVISMIVSMMHMTVYAVEKCEHHMEHTVDCGYVEGVSECTYHCDICLDYSDEEAEMEESMEFVAEVIETETICTCETHDDVHHVTNCAKYVALGNPECHCAEKCTEINIWCDVCGFDYTVSAGNDIAEIYTVSGTCGENLKWVLDADDTLTISGTGKMDEWNDREDVPWYDLTEEITAVIIENGVTSIGSKAFSGCSSLTNAKISETVTSIGSYAFSGCSSLTSIEIPVGVTSINYGTFSGCSSLTSIEIPDGVTSIGTDAFSGCSSLTSVEIPDEVTIIGSNAFGECISLTSIKIPERVTSINSGVFWRCKSLTSVKIPAGVTSIGNGAFLHCSSLESVEISKTVTSIDSCAFGDCSNLISVSFVGDVPEISESAFYEVTATVYYLANNDTWTEDVLMNYGGTLTWVPYCVNDEHAFEDGICIGCGEKKGTIAEGTCGENLAWVLYEDGILAINGIGEMDKWYDKSNVPWYIFAKEITLVIIENGVTNVGNYAFYSCSGLTSIEIPAGITSIGDYAFYGSSNLTSIEIPAGVANIGKGVFSNCSSLTSIEIPEDVTSIGSGTFYNCSSLTSIKIPDGVTSIGYGTFYKCSSLTSAKLPEGITSIGEDAFLGCRSLTSIEIPEGVASIGNNAFYNCSSLTSIKIPAGVTRIGACTFAGCSSLTSIEIPAGVTSIGSSMFYDCSSLTSVEIPEGVTSIGSSAFFSCSSLTSVEIPAGVTSIGNYAFQNSSGLTSVTFVGDVPLISENTFPGVTTTAYYPANNDTWTRDVCQNYGGKLTWIAYCLNDKHTFVNGICVDCGAELPAPSIEWMKTEDSDNEVSGVRFVDNWRQHPDKYTDTYVSYGLVKETDDFNAVEFSEGSLLDSTGKVEIDLNTLFYHILQAEIEYDVPYYLAAYVNIPDSEDYCCSKMTVLDSIPIVFRKGMTPTGTIPIYMDEQNDSLYIQDISVNEPIVGAYLTLSHKDTNENMDLLLDLSEQGKVSCEVECWECNVEKLMLLNAAFSNNVYEITRTEVTDFEYITVHKSKVTVIPATTSASGSMTEKCEKCGKIILEEMIPRVTECALSFLSCVFNGVTQVPDLLIKDEQGKVLTQDADYVVTYPASSVEPGTYVVDIVFQGNYSGEVSLEYTIRPKIAATNEQTNISYETLEEALAAAQAGQVIKMKEDVVIADRFAVIEADTVLDLNGFVLTVNNLWAFGEIIDSTNGISGGLKGSGKMILEESNTYMPLFDANDECYRFFEYDVKCLGKRANTNGSITYGFSTTFTNEDAYLLLKDTSNSEIKLVVEIDWDGKPVNKLVEYTVSDKVVVEYADKVYEQIVNGNTSKKYGINITVGGLTSLASGTTVTATMQLRTSLGVYSVGVPGEYIIGG